VATNILEHATRLYPGVAIQKMLGSTFASLFMYAGAAQQVRIKELDDYRIVDAKYDGASSYATADLQAGGVLMVLGEKKGRYDRLVFRFDQGCVNYDVRKVRNVTMGDLNFVVLDTGVCVCLTEDEKLELFSARMGSTSIKTVEDPVLGGDMKLTKHGGQVLFMRGEKLYSMKLK